MAVIHFCTFIAVSIYFAYNLYCRPAAPTAYIIYFFSLYYFSSVLGERVLIYDYEFELYWYLYYLVVVGSVLLGQLLASYLRFNFKNKNPKNTNKAWDEVLFYFDGAFLVAFHRWDNTISIFRQR